ncbi:unnamed protein product, partial [Effrenium voratum]
MAAISLGHSGMPEEDAIMRLSDWLSCEVIGSFLRQFPQKHRVEAARCACRIGVLCLWGWTTSQKQWSLEDLLEVTASINPNGSNGVRPPSPRAEARRSAAQEVVTQPLGARAATVGSSEGPAGPAGQAPWTSVPGFSFGVGVFREERSFKLGARLLMVLGIGSSQYSAWEMKPLTAMRFRFCSSWLGSRERQMFAFCSACTFLAISLISSFWYQIFRTQCFSRPSQHQANHKELRSVAPGSVEEAAALLELHQARNEPLLFANHTAMQGWGQNCWSPDCIQRRFGDLPIEGVAMGATLDDYMDAFFDDESSVEAECFEGKNPACTLQGGAPFCTRPCLTNATLNFALVEDSDEPFEDVLVDSLKSFPLLRRRAHKGHLPSARLLTWLVSSTVGFAPGADWVEGVLWLSPKGAQTGLHQDDEPCAVLHQ